MKRLLILCMACMAVLFLLSSCGGANPDFHPVAYPDSVRKYDDFSCVAFVGSEELRLTGDAAVQLYDMVCDACADSETVIAYDTESESVHLIFYTGGADTSSDAAPYLRPDAISYGQFIVRDDDSVRYSDHVLVSHGTTFKLKEGTYAELCALMGQPTQE